MSQPTRSFSLPDEFDHRKTSHVKKLNDYVTDKYGESFVLSGINVKTRTATVQEIIAADAVLESNTESKVVGLAEGTKKSDGDAKAVAFERDNPGFVMTDFRPLLGQAVLTKMDDRTRAARQAISNVLRVKPWDIKISPTKDGGYKLGLPDTYTHSKQYDKLCEVVEDTVGEEGWYITVDTKKLTALIIPSDPPTFPAMFPYPMDQTQIVPSLKLRFAKALPLPGEKEGPDFYLDFTDAMCQVGGLAGAGKSVAINDIIASALGAGFELAIADIPSKAVDFEWCKDYVRPYGWGCDSPYDTVAMLANLYDEGEKRAAVLKQHKAKNIHDLSDEVKRKEGINFVLIVVDELTGMFAKEVEPKSLPKDHPMRLEAQRKNIAVDLIKSYINKIAAEQRFVGMRLLAASQIASRDTGIDTKLRTNLQHKTLFGPSPTESNRSLIFPNPDSVPMVPQNVQSDPKASRGVGTVAPEGSPSAVIKAYYADTDALYDYLKRIGVPPRERHSPTREMVIEYMPFGDEDEGAGEADSTSVKNRKKMDAEAHTDPETGERLSGFEYANRQRAASVRKSEADTASGEGEMAR